MRRELEIIINPDGTYSIEGYNLASGESIEKVARFLTNDLGDVIERGHKHNHKVSEKSLDKTRITS